MRGANLHAVRFLFWGDYMLEIIYRIYEVADEETAAKNCEKSLNIMCTANVDTDQTSMEV